MQRIKLTESARTTAIRSVRLCLATSRQQANRSICLMFALAAFTCNTAKAEPPQADWFSVKLPSIGGSAAPSQKPAKFSTSAKTQEALAAKWFEKFDELVAQNRPTPADCVILNRPLMQEAERVQKWTATASKISKKYVLLTKALKQLPLSQQLSDVEEYRDLTIDWYHDAALVFDDMIRPRPPAKTIEELQRELDEVKNRSQTLTATTASLNAMDRDLRKRYKIGSEAQADELFQFAQGKPN